MKKDLFALTGVCLAVVLTACSDPNTTATTTTNADTITSGTTNNNYTSTQAGTNTNLPLNPADSGFVATVAGGNRMEIEAGNLAQQNAQSPRVKAFAQMMVQDHQNSQQELMSVASKRGLTVQDSLPRDQQQHVQSMRSMRGQQFDRHYMNMMVSHHGETIATFERQAQTGNDQELKAWAQKMLPALQKHRDSAVAINNAIGGQGAGR